MPGQFFPPTPGTVLQGPVLEAFAPTLFLIANVTNAVNAEVTTTVDHDYETGMVVRIIVPATYGMKLYNQATIVVTGATTFTTDLNTTNLDPFVAPSLYPSVAFTPAQVVPITGTEDNIST